MLQQLLQTLPVPYLLIKPDQLLEQVGIIGGQLERLLKIKRRVLQVAVKPIRFAAPDIGFCAFGINFDCGSKGEDGFLVIALG
ncbi:MAG: hypothetical protein PUC59_09480 [Firmicutes bacterium]|nr:hypothetical protein [Bacillota bacterium]